MRTSPSTFEDVMDDTKVYTLGDFALQSGVVIRDLTLAYQTYGELRQDKSNVILLNTPFGARHHELEWMLGPDSVFDTDKYFVVIPDMFGNGVSPSPSNCAFRHLGRWPHFTIYDNVVAQQRLLTEELGISEVALACGWSMGGMQAYQWACRYPESVKRLAVICGAARVSPHNYVFLEGVKTALQSVDDREQALRNVGRIYAGWALSQAFYRNEAWRTLGYRSLEDFLVGYWEEGFLKRDPDNLLAHIRTWQSADISANTLYQGNFERALQAIQANTLLLPGDTDLYFPVVDNRLELEHLKHAKLSSIPSIWGHRAGNPVGNAQDMSFLRNALRALLA